jgi:hypothetical protein
MAVTWPIKLDGSTAGSAPGDWDVTTRSGKGSLLNTAEHDNSLISLREAVNELKTTKPEAGDGADEVTKNSNLSASAEIWLRDPLRQRVEAATGGMCTVLYDDVGLPSYMRIIPAMTADTLMSGMPTTLHPAFLKNGVKIPELFIGMFQAYVIGGRAYSLPYKPPAMGMDFDDARGYCTAKGTGWHLMTNWEWAAVALWCMKNGFEPRGNTDHGRAHDATYETGTRRDGDTYAPGGSSGAGNILCGTGPYSWRHDGTPAGISDLVGNVWEWVEGFKLSDGRIYMPADNEYDLAEGSWPAMDHWFSDEADVLTLQNTAGTSTEDSLSVTWGSVAKDSGYAESDLLNMALISPNGVIPQGRLYVKTAGERLPIRGGARVYGINAGLAALHLHNVRGNVASFTGFRPAFVNI